MTSCLPIVVADSAGTLEFGLDSGDGIGNELGLVIGNDAGLIVGIGAAIGAGAGEAGTVAILGVGRAGARANLPGEAKTGCVDEDETEGVDVENCAGTVKAEG